MTERERFRGMACEKKRSSSCMDCGGKLDSSRKEHIVLRIYGGFAEVNEKVEIVDRRCKLTVSEEQFNQIARDSIDVDSDACCYQTITHKPTNLEGKTVYVRRGRTHLSILPEESRQGEEPKEVVLVRGRDWLVQDVKTKRYFHTSKIEMEFEEMPDTDVYDVEFFFNEACNTSETTLRYQLHTISWKPKYELNVWSDSSETAGQSTSAIKCVAVLDNRSPVDYFVEKAELFGGNVAINVVHPLMLRKAHIQMLGAAPASESDFPRANLVSTELGGIYMYELANSFTLNAKSTSYIEFIKPKLSVEEYSICQMVNPGSMSRCMDRMYLVVSEEFLPSGNICVRQNGRITGSQVLQDLPARERRELVVGSDAAALFQRDESMIGQDRRQSLMSVTVILINNHVTERMFRYREVHHLHKMSISFDKFDENAVKRIENGLEILAKIDPESTKTFKFNVSKAQLDQH